MSAKFTDRRPIPRLGLNRAELAVSISVSTGSIDQMVKEGVLPPPRLWHSRKIWLVSEIEAYLNEWPIDGEVPKAGGADWDDLLDHPTEAKTGPQRDPVQEHYESIGFDPKTMDQADYRRLYAEAHARWIATIPTLPLNKLEVRSLRQLAAYGVGVLAPSNKIKGCGPDTMERLSARGFILPRDHTENPDWMKGLVLTQKGLDFVRSNIASDE